MIDILRSNLVQYNIFIDNSVIDMLHNYHIYHGIIFYLNIFTLNNIASFNIKITPETRYKCNIIIKNSTTSYTLITDFIQQLNKILKAYYENNNN
jgi:hypothetical protein